MAWMIGLKIHRRDGSDSRRSCDCYGIPLRSIRLGAPWLAAAPSTTRTAQPYSTSAYALSRARLDLNVTRESRKALSYMRSACLPERMNDPETDRAIGIEFAIMALFVAGSFIAGSVAAVRYLLG